MCSCSRSPRIYCMGGRPPFTNCNARGHRVCSKLRPGEIDMNGRTVQRSNLILAACFTLAACNNSTNNATPLLPTAFAAWRLTAATGALDPAFGSGGRFIFDADPGDFDLALAVALQADGKVLSAGRTVVAGQTVIAVDRKNANGAVDTGFGTGGIVRTPVGTGGTAACALAVEPPTSNKILVAAISFDVNSSTTSLTLLRYNPDGTLDTMGFGTGGLVTAALGAGSDLDGCGLALQTDGKIVMAGATSDGNMMLFRYDTAGALDTAGFGTNGTGGSVVTNVGSGAMSPAIALQADGKIVLTGGAGALDGSTPIDQVVVRYKTDGTLDTTFGTGGIATTDIDARANWGNAIVVQPADGKIVVAGHSHVVFTSNALFSTASDISLVRYNPDGSLDMAAFGAGTG